MESSAEVLPILTMGSRAERATMRAAREMARRDAVHQSRMAHIELNDGLAITQPELERLLTCHRSPYQKLDWRLIATRPAVAMPVRTQERERAARQAVAGWHDRMFGDEAQRRREQASRVLEAQREDELIYQQAYRAAEMHNAEVLISRKLIDFDPKALKDAVALKSRLTELRDGVNSIALAMPGNGRVMALVEAIQEGDIAYERIVEVEPRARRELIPQAERRQIHLAALCAAALRIGAELVGVLPVEAVEVAVGCEMPDPNGGRPTPQPVLQVLVTARHLRELGWMKEDAVTLATSIGARLDWAIERGFAPIRLIPLSAQGQPLAA